MSVKKADEKTDINFKGELRDQAEALMNLGKRTGE
jgi:hypothetical protein